MTTRPDIGENIPDGEEMATTLEFLADQARKGKLYGSLGFDFYVNERGHFYIEGELDQTWEDYCTWLWSKS